MWLFVLSVGVGGVLGVYSGVLVCSGVFFMVIVFSCMVVVWLLVDV